MHWYTFSFKKATIFLFFFCLGFTALLNDLALEILKQHYITKRIRKFLIGNSRFLIQNLLTFLHRNERKLPFRGQNHENFRTNNILGRPDDLETVLSDLDKF